MTFFCKLALVAAAAATLGCSFVAAENRTREEGNESNELLNKVYAEQDELKSTLGTSVTELLSAAASLGDNVKKFSEEANRQTMKDLHDYLPYLRELYGAIPAKAYKKFVLQILWTAKRQSQDHCGQILFKYNPLHPANSTSSREKREAETMNLTKFGKIVSNVIANFDDLVQHGVESVAPAICAQIDSWLRDIIQYIKAKSPEDLGLFNFGILFAR